MSDDTTAAEAPEAPAATPTPQAPAPEATPASAEPDIPDTFDPAIAKKLRDEAKTLRTAKKQAEAEAADLRAKVEAFEAEKLSETERLQKQADDNAAAAQAATEALKTANLRAEVAVEAAKHGIDAKAAAKLIADEVEYNESTPTNVTDLVSGLVESGVLASKTPLPSSGLPANGQGGEVEKPDTTVSNRFGGDPLANPEAHGGGVYFSGA
jgi:hypothetical protein